MDIVTIVAGSITVASKIASALKSVSRAPREVTLVREDVCNLSRSLQAVQTQFNPQSTNYTATQLERLLQMTIKTKVTLDLLSELIDKSKTTGLFGRIRWTIRVDEVAGLRQSLQSSTAQLNLLVAILSE